MEISSSSAVTQQISAPAQQPPEQSLAREASTASNRTEQPQNPPGSTTVATPITASSQADSAALQATGERVGTLLDVQA